MFDEKPSTVVENDPEPSKSIQILWLIMMFGEFFVENRERLKI
jgi:hypothetical protein